MKFELTKESKIIHGVNLFRIKAIKAFSNIGKDELGGWIEKEGNLSQEGNAWVYGNARVSGNAKVSGNVWVYGNARVSGDAIVKTKKCILTIGALGDNRFITLIKSTKKINAGCFHGTLEEFKARVEKKYKGDSDYYMTFDLIEKYFNS